MHDVEWVFILAIRSLAWLSFPWFVIPGIGTYDGGWTTGSQNFWGGVH